MGLLDALNQVKQEKFDPSEGKTGSGFEKLPAGTYNVNLKEVNHGAWNSGTEYIRFTMEVLDGEEAGRQEFITPTLAEVSAKGKPIPDFVLATSIKTIKVIGQMAGFVVPDSVFAGQTETENYEAIAKAFQPYIGKVMQMTIKESRNKKDPDNPYRNYEFAQLEQPKKAAVKKDPFAGSGDTVNISDEDLPF
ncbi:DUF669 domain-containing protein [Lactobacillus sp. ESL0731]|uniref:DUF669 domain-containing protein n=1 Tax=unclassified Lactobacillus TaxID=2620435 RepID=UPI0023F86AEF|nr:MULTISPECIES: DUF669 domain-containing protein [unclassified Lactobacillus]WEV51649.1 DUF669 domain-containing protein [Lactobacillus sp. ESL0700]WEV62778.1 DUF669 domain-containing protein [Lactobacillus sp. ESL0731]